MWVINKSPGSGFTFMNRDILLFRYEIWFDCFTAVLVIHVITTYQFCAGHQFLRSWNELQTSHPRIFLSNSPWCVCFYHCDGSLPPTERCTSPGTRSQRSADSTGRPESRISPGWFSQCKISGGSGDGQQMGLSPKNGVIIIHVFYYYCYSYRVNW